MKNFLPYPYNLRQKTTFCDLGAQLKFVRFFACINTEKTGKNPRSDVLNVYTL